LFFKREESRDRPPSFLEKDFRWFTEDVKFTGRWDRIDVTDKGAVIADFKASRAKDQKEADKKTRDSLQMDLYALSFIKTHEEPLLETQLHFLESDIIGHALKGKSEQDRALEKIDEVKEGIKKQDYRARPDWHNCNYCDFKTICPDSYAY
ncbi:MAG: PD-(D/E)XK nuclease family protein, partial [Candidatus Aminicenantes bacterium]